jgi:hypothetical protein
MRAVNLLPSERPRPGETRTGGAGGGLLTTTRVAVAGGSIAVIAVGFVGFNLVGARDDVSSRRETLRTVQQQVAEAQARAAAEAAKHRSPAPAALPADTRAQLDAFNLAASTRIAWDQLLGDVSKVLPAGSWLSSLTLQGAPSAGTTTTPAASTPAPGAAPTGFVASGFALSQPVVARLMERLALVPMLSDITLQRSERADFGTAKAFQFTLSANVRPIGAS